MTSDISKFERFANQGEDVLLSPEEAEKVIQVIDSIEQTKIVEYVISILEGKPDIADFQEREIFYVTLRPSIIDAMNKKGKEIAEIILSTAPEIQGSIPMSVIMALILNNIVVEFADRKELKNISNNPGQEKYDVRIGYNGKTTGKSRGYKSKGKPEALRSALKTRKDLYQERENKKSFEEEKKVREAAKQGLIEKGILIPTERGSTQYKIANIRIRDGRKSSSRILVFRRQVDGRTEGMRRSISEHGFTVAFGDILREYLRVTPLSLKEQEILSSPEFKKQSLYS